MKRYLLLFVGSILGLQTLPASAQVKAVVDMAIAQFCLANNWGSPSLEKQLAGLSQSEKDNMLHGLEATFSPKGVACLQKTRPFPVEACAKLLAGGENPVFTAQQEKKMSDCLELRTQDEQNDEE
ncbi:hypothetical protein [Uliginosibacterium gangwonense]|uniref:hypothetical protein n=1 Tax=Uliginosibacterium gangwonense TaxID=392736 RepID=UPI00037A120F|nr:hypothetical protein [Uliginosibacterium gangwonense]